MLSVHQLRKSFFHRPVLADISFSIGPGEVVGLLGKNGTGKSTLLRVIAGLSSADAGDVRFMDNPVRSTQTENRKDMLYLGHAPGMYPGLSARENLEFASRIYYPDRKQFPLDEILENVGLRIQADDPIKIFSQGMLQRLKLALAKTIDWKLLLFDEPFSGLDLQGRVLTQTFFDQSTGPDRSMLLVVHEVEWALEHCTRIIILGGGHVIYDQENGAETREDVKRVFSEIMA